MVDLGQFRLCRIKSDPGTMKTTYSLWAIMIMVFCVLQISSLSVDREAKEALLRFLNELSNYNMELMHRNGWDDASDPCDGSWRGVVCENGTSIKELLLNRTDLSGNLDITHLCETSTISTTLSVLLLHGNNIAGRIDACISRCQQLKELNVSRNRLDGFIPELFGALKNLKRLDISRNGFIGQLPDLSHISGLNWLALEYNGLSGRLPMLNFSNLHYFNVSYNNFSGSIPDVAGFFSETSFYGNPLLCGSPLKKTCPNNEESSISSHERLFMYVGHAMLFLVLFGAIYVKFFKRRSEIKKWQSKDNVGTTNDKTEKKKPLSSVAGFAMEIKFEVGKSDTWGSFAIAPPVKSMPEENTTAKSESISESNSLVILSSQAMSCMTFDELLKAPAELLGIGKYASLYKVECSDGREYTVKRIKAWGISCADFTNRMQKISQVKHTNVLPAVAFYSSKREKLLVYKYQPNGSLLGLLQGKTEEGLGWGWRLEIAAKTAVALAHLHQELHDCGIGHGNLKSSNIILTEDMEPCISEYGLKETGDHGSSSSSYPSSLSFLQGLRPDQRSTPDSDPSADAFQRDVYNFGLILLELLTGRVVQSNTAFSLAKWVHSVVREEWTVEVFDKSLVSEGASEERMVNLLKVALSCVNKSPDARPTSSQVATLINKNHEEEERASSPLHTNES
ncbi:hypothetical protein MLD38_024479 [Melastoma candidum]|uniref:Uncharacterized protein n=1 Tax=Melastoma candidum TaxID=119954 RepID=A0ACB9NTE0_9MYRT|nr:hypothetical protein MLD38_024479 [Melastoma candidum]